MVDYFWGMYAVLQTSKDGPVQDILNGVDDDARDSFDRVHIVVGDMGRVNHVVILDPVLYH